MPGSHEWQESLESGGGGGEGRIQDRDTIDSTPKITRDERSIHLVTPINETQHRRQQSIRFSGESHRSIRPDPVTSLAAGKDRSRHPGHNKFKNPSTQIAVFPPPFNRIRQKKKDKSNNGPSSRISSLFRISSISKKSPMSPRDGAGVREPDGERGRKERESGRGRQAGRQGDRDTGEEEGGGRREEGRGRRAEGGRGGRGGGGRGRICRLIRITGQQKRQWAAGDQPATTTATFQTENQEETETRINQTERETKLF